MILFFVIAFLLSALVLLLVLSPRSEIRQSFDMSFYEIGDGSGNFLSFDNDFSLASSSKTGSKLKILENKYLQLGDKFVSYKAVAGGYLVVLLNTKMGWEITDHSVSIVIGDKTYYLGFNRTGMGVFEIVSVGLSTSPKTLMISKA